MADASPTFQTDDPPSPVTPIGIVSPMYGTQGGITAFPAALRTPLLIPQPAGTQSKPDRTPMCVGNSRLPFPTAGRIISTGEGIQLLRTENPTPKSDQQLTNGSPEESNVLTVKWIHQRPPTARSASASKEHTTRFLIPKAKDYKPVESTNRWPSPTPSTPQPWDDGGDADEDGGGPRLEVYEMFPPPLVFPEQFAQPNAAADILREKMLTEINPRPSTTSALPRPGRGTSAAFANVQSKIEAMTHLIQEAVKATSYYSDTLVECSGSYSSGLWACVEYDRPPISPTRHEVSVVDVNQQYVHLLESSASATRPTTANALSDLVWTHRIVPPDDFGNFDRATLVKLAKAAEAQSQKDLASQTPATMLEHKMEVSPGAFEWITDSLCIKIPGIFDPMSVPIVGSRTLPPEPTPLPPLNENESLSNEDSTKPAHEVERKPPETACSAEDRSPPAIPDSTPKDQSPLPPLPKLQSETADAPAADPRPSSGTTGTIVLQPLHQRPISAWALDTRVPLNSAMRAQIPEPTLGARVKSANVASKAKAKTTMEPAIKLAEEKARFAEGFKVPRDRPVSAVLISRQVVPSTVEVENTESCSYRPNTASTNSTRPGTRLPSAAPRAITLTAVSHGWQSNDQTPSELGQEEYGLARSGRSTPDLRSAEYDGSFPEVLTEGWFVQNMRREGALVAASTPEPKLPSIAAPMPDDGLPSAFEPETATCTSGAEGRDLSAPRKRRKVKKRHRKSRGRKKRDAQKQKVFDAFEEQATDIFGRSCQFEGADIQNSGRSSRACRPGSSLPGSAKAPLVEDENHDELENVKVSEPAPLPRPEKAADEGMRLILQVKHLVGALQRAMRTHWMKVQHTLYMDMIHFVQSKAGAFAMGPRLGSETQWKKRHLGLAAA
ncbi:hypothetical protein HDU87_007390 [Geranomyces variabilis]|uniref:Uncharacterized protein n=1 Tax=Geranomyces variabilis TaxID=109894 RepID=A0AAD5TU72_9FUNG|nr:hypothetical protein HDU87_007390 [Geranomyces variabilis]